MIFEGSQGLLLDKCIGFFPHVTRSNTGTKNPMEMLGYDTFDAHAPSVFLLTRAYQTRHGNGPMTNESRPHKIILDDRETNRQHTYQGEFRRAMLDLDLLAYGMGRDEYVKAQRKRGSLSLVVSCLDHVSEDYSFTYDGRVHSYANKSAFVRKICDTLGINEAYTNTSPESRTTKAMHRYMSDTKWIDGYSEYTIKKDDVC
jgi:adenylosuccinate synthase